MTTFELNLKANSREQAKYIADKWEKEHEEIYPIILELLTKK